MTRLQTVEASWIDPMVGNEYGLERWPIHHRATLLKLGRDGTLVPTVAGQILRVTWQLADEQLGTFVPWYAILFAGQVLDLEDWRVGAALAYLVEYGHLVMRTIGAGGGDEC